MPPKRGAGRRGGKRASSRVKCRRSRGLLASPLPHTPAGQAPRTLQQQPGPPTRPGAEAQEARPWGRPVLRVWKAGVTPSRAQAPLSAPPAGPGSQLGSPPPFLVSCASQCDTKSDKGCLTFSPRRAPQTGHRRPGAPPPRAFLDPVPHRPSACRMSPRPRLGHGQSR